VEGLVTAPTPGPVVGHALWLHASSRAPWAECADSGGVEIAGTALDFLSRHGADTSPGTAPDLAQS
jgi:hypothetical protein